MYCNSIKLVVYTYVSDGRSRQCEVYNAEVTVLFRGTINMRIQDLSLVGLEIEVVEWGKGTKPWGGLNIATQHPSN